MWFLPLRDKNRDAWARTHLGAIGGIGVNTGITGLTATMTGGCGTIEGGGGAGFGGIIGGI